MPHPAPDARRNDDVSELAGPLRDLRHRFEALLEPHREDLWRFCRRLTGSSWDAEDLAQETMMKAFAALPSLWQPANPRAWLFRIASNAWIDQRRREREPVEPLGDGLELAGDTDPDLPLRVTEAIERMIGILPPRQRTVFLLCDTLDFTARETGAMLGMSEGAVKAALHRARTRLARPVNGDGHAEGTRLLDRDAPPPLVQRYVDAFNRRDADAIAGLLAEDVNVTIVGSAIEIGREAVRTQSLAEWAGDPRAQHVRAGEFEGRPTLFVFHETGQADVLAWLTTFDASGDAIRDQRIYYFCPELIGRAATALGVSAATHGYQYIAAGA